MTAILPQIQVNSSAAPETVLMGLRARGKEWRESRLGDAARRGGVVRWNVEVTGAQVRITPAYGGLSGGWRLNQFALELGCRVSASPTGSCLVGKCRPSRSFLLLTLILVPHQFLYPVVSVFGDGAYDPWDRWQAGAVQITAFLILSAVLFVIAAWKSRDPFVEVIDQALHTQSGREPAATAAVA